MSSPSAAKWQKRTSFRATDINLLMYLIEIEYNIAGKCGTVHYMYFKPGMTAIDVISDLIKNENINDNVDIAGLYIEVSTGNTCQRIVDNLGINLEMKPGMEMNMQVSSREAQAYTERELQTTPELYLVSA